MAKAFLREQIFNANDIKVEQLTMDEWGGVELELRAMTGKARAAFLNSSINPATGKVDLERMYPDLLIACVYDPEDGQPIFEAADREMLNSKSGKALERVAQVAMRLSGLSSDAAEEAEKN